MLMYDIDMHLDSFNTKTSDDALFELTFSSCSGDMYLLRRVSTFHLTNNGEVGGQRYF